jgi:glycosyltransferase involved in cell wall biosynthesis
MKYTIGIDASRNRSGGAKVHLVGILNELNPCEFGINEVHVWSYSDLLNMLPEKEWLVKHSPKQLEQSIIKQLFWQKFLFSKELKKYNCDVVLNTDAGTVGRFKPSVTMSRDMLSYEAGEIDRYKYSKSWVRLFLLKYMQNKSFRVASGVIFLTNYASSIIQQSCGKLNEVISIPHGVSDTFKNKNIRNKWPYIEGEEIKCLYVSNSAPYKHQWSVIRAIHKLRNDGWNLSLTLAGAKDQAFDLVEEAMKECSGNEFVELLDHVPSKKLPDLLASANLFIFASSCENMPNTLVEAMSVGLPIACSERGPMPEVLEDNGVYFDPENIDTIVNSLEKIISDRSFAKNIADKAKVKSLRYSWKRCSKETFDYLIKILERNQ